MAAPKLKSKVGKTTRSPEEIQPLVYDASPFWQSTLFSDVYLRNDVPFKYRDVWENEESGPFHEFCEQFRNLCEELKGESFHSWSERTTINRFIKPVLKLLGWANKCSPNQEPWTEDETLTIKEAGELHTFKPDFLIVNDPKQLKYIEAKDGEAKLDEARSSCIISIEAKYWGRIDESKYSKREDKSRADKKSGGDATRALDFDEQCLKYVDILHHDYGILTDGRTWRLYHRELSSGSFKRCYQFNLGKLAKHVLAGMDKDIADYRLFVENAKYFYHIFSKAAVYDETGGRRFLDDLISDSRKYSMQVEEDLKVRFVRAMAIACNGFRRALGKEFKPEHLDVIRGVSESHIFNILFIRYCESRNILPVRQNPEYRKTSLSNVVDKLDFYDPAKEADDLNTPVLKRRFREDFGYESNGTELYDRLIGLVSILQDGLAHPAAKFAIEGFKQTVFDEGELKFLKRYKLSNSEMTRLLFEMTYIESDKAHQYQQIAYSFFAPRQLGSIYESFLEFKLDIAQESMVFHKGQWKSASLKSDKVDTRKLPSVQKGDLFFTPDNIDRKMSGTYYTPDDIVQLIIKKTVGPLVSAKSPKQLLALTVCDPSMGSGHFLCGVLNFLARQYLSALNDDLKGDVEMSIDDAKRIVLRSCIFGVDVNSRAVKLAKMGLWLESAQSGHPLENLDEQLVTGDSLIERESVSEHAFTWRKAFPAVFKSGGFDAVIGNPPYIFSRDKKFTEDKKSYFAESYSWSSYQSNTYCLFIELSNRILKSGGRLGYIIPNNWMTLESYETFRKSYIGSFADHTIVNSKDKIFEDASVDNSIIVSMKDPGSESKQDLTLEQIENGKLMPIGKRKYGGQGVVRFSQVQDDFESSYNALEKSQTIGDVFEVKCGLKAYQTGKGVPAQTDEIKESRAFHSSHKKSKDFMPYLHGKDVCRYVLLKHNEYLKYGDHLAEPRNLSLFSGPRVLVRQIPSKPPYCIQAVATELECLNDINSMVIKTPSMQHAVALMAVLNTQLLSRWFVHKFDKFQRKTFPQFKVRDLKQFPIPDLSSLMSKPFLSLVSKLQTLLEEDQTESNGAAIKRIEATIEAEVENAFFKKAKTRASA